MEPVILPDAPWRHRPGLSRVVEALGPEKARFVGGAVRDTLLGIDTSDVDIATVHAPERVIALLTGNGIKAVPTGLAHGTITAVADHDVVEVTTLRCDVATDGRHATVAFSTDWREDAARRDFTINALYADPVSGQVFDYFGGLEDLKTRRVRFIGDPYRRIAEDHLRILRFFRFHARFGAEVDAEALEACAARANDLMALSRERIASELLKLLVAPNALPAVELMVQHGILVPVLPEIDSGGIARLTILAAREPEPDAIRRLAALLPPAAKIAEDVGARLKLSKSDRKRLTSATQSTGDEGPRGLAYRIGPVWATDRLLLAGEDIGPLSGWAPPSLPISGGALVERGVSAGPEVATLLRAVETQWIAEDFPDASRVEQIADDAVAQWRVVKNA